ncbi:Signal transduction histidine kinase [Clostridium cavendishii DSM 21758]|uniref:histidine kinase n=1 Tax=Clostridium cavendishii DSM 21758 TaxID=1121302 RepID=A0A1M6HUL0_9CLOT|nr:Signal transduction histidine kinase [Clostridium cavendishii DSM 21758]
MEEGLKNFNFKKILNENNIHKYIIFILLLPFILYIRKANHIIAHSIIETLNTAICFSSVIIIINSYRMSQNNYFLFFGALFGFVSLFNCLHCVVYMESSYNPKVAINLSEQLNITFRLVEGISIMISFIFLYRPLKKYIIFYFYIIISLVLVYIIFFTNYFPTCFIVSVGKTRFAIMCDIIVIFSMLLSIILFFKNRKYFSKKTVTYMGIYLILSILVRYMVIINNSTYNDFDICNHTLKFISYYFLYKALVENVIKNPVNAIFNDLNNKNIDLQLKTIELEKTIIKLNDEKLKTEKINKELKLLNEAKENEKLKTEFFANLSHELKTPINVIYSALQLLELNNKDEVSQKYNKIIKQNCYRLLRLINNIIDSTKIDSGFLNLNLTYSNVVMIVEDVVLSVSNYIEAHGMNVIFDTNVEEKYLNIDLDAIERILLNLISNSVKFRSNNGTIYVSIFDKQESVIISVKDDGIGIPTEQQKFIFDKFKQVDKSFTRNKEGSGMGLSLVKALVELHKGTIAVKSEVGVGSEFIIELPVLESVEHELKNNRSHNSNIIKNIDIEFSDIYF